MTAKPVSDVRRLPLARLLTDLQRPMGCWPAYQDIGRWRIWTCDDTRTGTRRQYYVGRLKRVRRG